jgi:adenylate kinase
MGKRLLLFGPPGVGKGTHARRLAEDLGVPHVASGDLFRAAIQRGTELGHKAVAFMIRGALVPDEVTVSLLEDRLGAEDTAQGYLLDGFPRTVAQAVSLERHLERTGTRVDAVLSLEAPEDVLVKRVAGRSTCTACGASFNVFSRPPAVAGVCDACGGVLRRRPDDDEDTVRHRLNDYMAKTEPVLDFFRQRKWPVRAIHSVGGVDEIYGRIREAVGG